MNRTSKGETAVKRIARIVAAAVLGNIPYMKRSDRIGLVIGLFALALLLSAAVWSRRHT